MKPHRSPLFHFLLLGLLIFVVQVGYSSREEATRVPQSQPISIDRAKVEELESSFRQQAGRGPTERDLAMMVAAEVDEEILYREALARNFLARDRGIEARLIQKMLFLETGARIEDSEKLLERAIALGLHREDIVVRRILVQKMRLHESRLEPGERPSRADVEEAFAQNSDRFREASRRSGTHVFLSSDRRGAETSGDARLLREHLVNSAIPPSEAVLLGDPFPLGHELAHRSEQELENSFGRHFGREVFESPFETWSGPIASAYGQHLIWVSTVQPERPKSIEDVEDRIRGELERDRREEKLRAFLRAARDRYEIAIETAEVKG